MATKVVSRIAVMSALCVVLRIAFSSLPNVQPVTAIFLGYLLYFGLAEASLVMMLCLLSSSFLLGFGPGFSGRLRVLLSFSCFGGISFIP